MKTLYSYAAVVTQNLILPSPQKDSPRHQTHLPTLQLLGPHKLCPGPLPTIKIQSPSKHLDHSDAFILRRFLFGKYSLLATSTLPILIFLHFCLFQRKRDRNEFFARIPRFRPSPDAGTAYFFHFGIFSKCYRFELLLLPMLLVEVVFRPLALGGDFTFAFLIPPCRSSFIFTVIIIRCHAVFRIRSPPAILAFFRR